MVFIRPLGANLPEQAAVFTDVLLLLDNKETVLPYSGVKTKCSVLKKRANAQKNLPLH